MLTSSMLPTDTKYEKPMPSSSAQSSTEVHNAPDCEIKPMCPFDGVAAAKLAFRLIAGTMMPRQLGPKILMPSNFRCSTRTSSSSLRPSTPISRNPAEMITTPRVPASPHCRTMGATVAAGVQITAKSGRMRQARDVLVRLNPLNGLPLGIDRVNHSAKAGADQIPQHRISDARRRISSANNGDAMGLENLVEIPNTHAVAPGCSAQGRDRPVAALGSAFQIEKQRWQASIGWSQDHGMSAPVANLLMVTSSGGIT